MSLRRLATLTVPLVVALLRSEPALAVSVELDPGAPAAVGEMIEFRAVAVGNGEITYSWDFGDGTRRNGAPDAVVRHVYTEPGHYSVIVVAKDATGVRSDSIVQTVHRALPQKPPRSASTIVFDPARQRVCNVNADNHTVSCTSAATLELLFEAPVGRHPRTLALDASGAIWVANQDDSTVSILRDGTESTRVALPYGSRPFGVAVDPNGAFAYVTLQGTSELAQIDVATEEVVARVGVGPMPSGVAISSSGGRIFVTRLISPATHAEVVELSALPLSLRATHALAFDPGPDTEATGRGVPNYLRHAVISPDEATLWLPSKKDNVARGLATDGQALTFESSVRTILSFWDLGTNRELLSARVDLNNRALGLSVAFSALGDYAFVGYLANDGVEVIDAYSGKVVSGLFELPHAPDGLVLDDQGRLWLNTFLSRSLTVLDASGIVSSTDLELTQLAEVRVSEHEQLSDQVLEGKRIFHDASDPRMADDGYLSCAVCHLDGFEDGMVWDFTDRGEGLRNTTSLLGRAGMGQGRLHWSANFDEVQDFEHDIRGAFGGTGFLSDSEFEARATSLGEKKAGVSAELDALAAYVSSLDRVHASPYRNADGSLTEAGFRGRDIFVESGCPECHGGPEFTDSATGARHDVGTLSARSGQRLAERLDGFDTPTLRGVWETAPYLHDGSAATLQAVITARNPDDRHGRTRSLSEQQRADLVAYLLQIDNTPLEHEQRKVQALGEGGCAVAGPGHAARSLDPLLLALALCLVARRGRASATRVFRRVSSLARRARSADRSRAPIEVTRSEPLKAVADAEPSREPERVHAHV